MKCIGIFFALLIILYVRMAFAACDPDEDVTCALFSRVKFHALNKITTQLSEFEVDVGGDPYNLGGLAVSAQGCVRGNMLEGYKAAIRIQRTFSGSNVFSGWLISGYSDVSTIPDPIYEIELLSCF